MSRVHATRIETPAGYRSREAARFVAQLDAVRAALIERTRGLDAADLGWQPAPGMNTIGMLLAHIAYSEAHLGQVGLLREPTGHAEDVIGITEQDEGLPLAPDGPPSPALDGRPLEFFDDLLARAREHTRRVCRTLTDEDLAREIRRPPRADGTVRVFDPAWVLFHMLEHESSHLGQIQLLIHLRRARA